MYFFNCKLFETAFYEDPGCSEAEQYLLLLTTSETDSSEPYLI